MARKGRNQESNSELTLLPVVVSCCFLGSVETYLFLGARSWEKGSGSSYAFLSLSCRAQKTSLSVSLEYRFEILKSSHGSLYLPVPGEGPQEGPGLILQGHGRACPCHLLPYVDAATNPPALTWGTPCSGSCVWLLALGHCVQLSFSPSLVALYPTLLEEVCGHMFAYRPG